MGGQFHRVCMRCKRALRVYLGNASETMVYGFRCIWLLPPGIMHHDSGVWCRLLV